MISYKSEIIEHHGFHTIGNKQREFKQQRGATLVDATAHCIHILGTSLSRLFILEISGNTDRLL